MQKIPTNMSNKALMLITSCGLFLIGIFLYLVIVRQNFHPINIWEYYVDIGLCKKVYVLMSSDASYKEFAYYRCLEYDYPTEAPHTGTNQYVLGVGVFEQ